MAKHEDSKTCCVQGTRDREIEHAEKFANENGKPADDGNLKSTQSEDVQWACFARGYVCAARTRRHLSATMPRRGSSRRSRGSKRRSKCSHYKWSIGCGEEVVLSMIKINYFDLRWAALLDQIFSFLHRWDRCCVAQEARCADREDSFEDAVDEK